MNDKKNIIGSEITINVEQTIKGEQVENLKIVLIGGKLDGKIMFINSAPNYIIGEKTLLFLTKNNEGKYQGYYKIVGLAQGKYNIKDTENGSYVFREQIESYLRIDSKQVIPLSSKESIKLEKFLDYINSISTIK